MKTLPLIMSGDRRAASCGIVRRAAHPTVVYYRVQQLCGEPIHPVHEASTPDLVSSYPYNQPNGNTSENTQQHLICGVRIMTMAHTATQ